MRVYADNAATTKLSPAAKEAMLPYFDEIYGNPSTLYTLGQEAAEHLLACRAEIAQLIGAATRARSCSPPAAARLTIRPSFPPPETALAKGKSI